MHDHVLITGASRGLGCALARAFHAAGARVSAVARSEPELRALADELGHERLATARLDLADRATLRPALAALEARFGPVDALINNAGTGSYKPFLESSPEELALQVEVNLLGLVLLTREVVPAMVARGRGHLVHIASDLARKPLANMAVYAATKHAVAGFSQSLARELRTAGVKSTVVNPGIVNTHFGGRAPSANTQPWELDPGHLAGVIVDLVRQPPGVNVDELSVHALGQDF
ncbi:MAG: SDR family oxidoreductase [Planctomycetota bacterium]